jgi:hypothetical protein
LSDDSIAAQILDYLGRCENAQDTFEGIARWWVVEGGIDYRMAQVRAAVAALISDGRLESIWRPGQETLFKRKER